MKKLIVAAIAACAFAVAGPAGAALVIAPYDPTGACTVNTFNNGVLHLEKKATAECANTAAGADITGFAGQTFATASFTLASPTQCNGGSPRFDIQDASGKVFFLGCNNVTPVTNANGTVTYNFTMADLLRINPTLGAPGAIQAVDVAVDIPGVADISRIVFNGALQVPAGTGPTGMGPGSKADCKHGGWRTFTNPTFRNQGQCVSYAEHHNGKGKDDDDDKSVKSHKSDDHKSKSDEHKSKSDEHGKKHK
jgi:hypothetical protein